MPTIVDTGFLFALADTDDANHGRAVNLTRTLTDTLTLPVSVLPEICYLLDSRLGHPAMRQFVKQLLSSSIHIETITDTDLKRAYEILTQYADARVDFVYATIMAAAERLNIQRILTVDQRHFRLFRPRHCIAFELLP